MRKKAIFGIITSGLAVGFILYQFDIKELNQILENWNPYYLIPIVLSNFWATIAFAYRWQLLLENKISLKDAIYSSFIGVGANMFLPARGGDLLRLYYCKQESHIGYPLLLSRIFIEKVIDLGIVIFIGASSFLLLGLSDSSANLITLFISGFVLLGMVIGLIVLRFFSNYIIQITSKFADKIGKRELFETKIANHIIELSEFLTWKKLNKPLGISVVTWLLGYSITYLLQAYLIGLNLNYITILFMVFCGAMSVAVPSAPSGIGIFHASIISGFILTGLESSDGFRYATAVHITQFLTMSGFFVLFYFSWSLRKGGKFR